MSTVGVGRPTTQDQQKIDDTLRFLFESGVGQMAASKKTGHSPKTVKTRYSEWAKELAGMQTRKFLNRQDRAKEVALLAFDKQLVELLTIQQQIIEGTNKAQTDAKSAQRPMTEDEIIADTRTKLAWHITDLTDKKAALEMTPTVADKVKEEVSKFIAQQQKRKLTIKTRETGK